MLTQAEIDNLKAKAAACVARVNALVPDTALPPPTGETITVNAATQYQTMRGWEATSVAYYFNKTALAYDPTWQQTCVAVADRLVNEVGLNRMQIGIGSGWLNPVDYFTQFQNGQINYNQWGQHFYEKIAGAPYQHAQFDFQCDTMLLPMRAAMQAKGEALWTSMIFVDFGGTFNGNFPLSTNPSAYAAMVLHYVDRMKTRCGVTPNSIDVCLEPENTDASNQWTGARLGAAIVALRAALNAGGYPAVQIIGPSVTNQGNAVTYLDQIATVSGALAALNVASYHRYGSGNIAAIQQWAASRGKQTAMTELFNATVDVLLDDLLIGQVSHWQKWSMAGRVGGSVNGYYIVDPTASPIAINFAPNVSHMALIFPYVRIGAQRISATSSSGMKVVAFQNANGKRVVHCSRTQAAASVTITGLASGAYGVRRIPAASSTPINDADVTANASGAAVVPLAPGNTTIYAR